MTGKVLRKQRAVKATESEWALVRARAAAAGMSASGYVVRRALASEAPEGPSLGTLAARLERIETAVLTLCEVERLRLAERGEDADWIAAVRRVALRMRSDPARSDGAEGAG